MEEEQRAKLQVLLERRRNLDAWATEYYRENYGELLDGLLEVIDALEMDINDKADTMFEMSGGSSR